MNRRARVAVPVLLLAGAGAVWWWVGRQSDAGPDELFGSGVVEATEADLGFQVPGRIATLDPREGDRVAEGQELATLDRSELTARRAAALGQLSATESRLLELERGARPEEIAQAEAHARIAEERARDAERDLRRAETLYEGGAVSQEALDKARTAHALALAGRDQAEEALALTRQGVRHEVVAAQRAVVDQARAALAQVEALWQQASVTAPFDGLVTIRHREPGESVAAGAPVVRVRNMDDRWVRIYVRGDEIGRVHIGQAARVFSDTFPERPFEGSVAFIGSEAEFTPRNVQTTDERTRLVYPVKVRITGDAQHVLKPGVPADVRLLEAPGS